MKINELKNIRVVSQPETESTPERVDGGGSFLSRTVSNIPSSAAEFGKGIVSAVTNPVQTVKGVASIASGGVQKLIPGRQSDEASFDALIDFYKNRYGSVDKLMKTIETDPVGFASDASLALSGSAGLLGKAGKISKISSLSTASKAISGASKVIDPVSSVSSIISSTAKSTFPPIARLIEKSNLRLSPTQKADLGNKVNELADFASKNKLVGTPNMRFEKASAIINGYENTLGRFFDSIPDTFGIKKDTLINELENLKNTYKNDRDSLAINKQIDEVVRTVKKQQPDVIPYKNVNKLKRTTYENAYNKAGNKILDDVEHSIGDIFRQSIENGLDNVKIAGITVGEFNKNYGKMIQLKKLLKIASGRPQISGVTERILGSLIGYSTGGGPAGALLGAAAGPAIIGNIPVTAVRSGVSSGLQSLSQIKVPPIFSGVSKPLNLIERLQELQKEENQ